MLLILFCFNQKGDSMEQRIPKIIHYCWFGGNPKPELVQKCINSWRVYCPDYEIKEWNEHNFDVCGNVFTKEAYEAKKWAFVSDYVRALALHQYGGIYLDTDMELFQPLDQMLVYSFFAGFESRDSIGSAIMGSNRDNDILHAYVGYYQNKRFLVDGKRAVTTSPMVLTRILAERGLMLNGKTQPLSTGMIFSKNTFYPTGLLWVFGKHPAASIGVHHYMESWGRAPVLGVRSNLSRLRLCLVYVMRNIIGTKNAFELGKKLRIMMKQ